MSDLEFFVEYRPNVDEGEQSQELSETEFADLLSEYKRMGVDPLIDYQRFTIFDNGRDGRRLTIRDDSGIYYG